MADARQGAPQPSGRRAHANTVGVTQEISATMRHQDASILPSQSETYGAHMRDDSVKPGRTPSRWSWWWIRVLYSDYTTAGTSQALDISALATAMTASSNPALNTR